MMSRGGSRISFRRGCTRRLLYVNTNKPHSFCFCFFFCRIPVVLENRRSSQVGGGAHPLHPPPRSAPDEVDIPGSPPFKGLYGNAPLERGISLVEVQ